MTIIVGEKISRQFGQGDESILALEEISLQVDSGEFLAITGPSGSGKSTLLNILSALDQPSTGAVKFQDQTLNKLNNVELAQMRNQAFGFIFQSPHVLPHKTVAENVALPFQYNLRRTSHSTNEIVTGMLSYVGLEKHIHRYPGTLSGGELQRVVFARALIQDPQIIFADEPTGSLDADNSHRLLKLLSAQAQKGRTIVMATHDQVAMEYASRTLVLDKFSSHASE